MTVFISHSRQNGGAALKLSERLTRKGVKVWLDICELEAGQDWNERVAEAIRSADAFLVLVGPSQAPDRSQNFEWQQITELEYYLDTTKPIVPVVMGSAEVPGFLRTRQCLTVDPSAIDFDDLAARIAAALQTPDATVDHAQLERGRASRDRALESLKEHTRELEMDDVKRAGLRGLK